MRTTEIVLDIENNMQNTADSITSKSHAHTLHNFSKIRSFFWPIYSNELKKLIPMFSVFFLISFIYNLLRPLKQSVVFGVIDQSHLLQHTSGADAVPFLKFAVLLGAFCSIYFFTKVSNLFTREKVFYIILSIFIGFFSLFIFIIYPNKEIFSLDYLGGLLLNSSLLPQGYKVISVLVQHWYCSVFYVFCELWGTVMLSMLFWGYANEVTSVDEAKRFYAIFALGSNLSGIFSGIFGQFLVGSGTGSDVENWDNTIRLQIGLVLTIAFIIVACFYFLSNHVFAKEQVEVEHTKQDANKSTAVKSKKPKLSLMECFRYLASSPYLTSVVVIVVSYNLLFNLCDVLFTHHVKEMYTDTNSFNKYMNLITSGTGLISVVFAFVVSGNVLRYFGWIPAAMITPVIWIFTTIGFMCGMIIPMANAGSIVLFFGALQMCLGRASKYTVFDETKEIVFIPLTKEEQRKGKAVVDGIASRFGKTGGSIVYLVLLGLCGSIPNTVPYVAAISCVVMFVWIFAVFHLGKLVKNTVDAELQTNKPAAKVQDTDISTTAVPA